MPIKVPIVDVGGLYVRQGGRGINEPVIISVYGINVIYRSAGCECALFSKV